MLSFGRSECWPSVRAFQQLHPEQKQWEERSQLLPSVVAVFSRGIVSHRKCNGILQMFFVFSYSLYLYFPSVISQIIIV